jgi:magnesium-transporting ATPase (P-type)
MHHFLFTRNLSNWCVQVEIFQSYSDTVISVGLSHMPSNDGIFSVSDIAVGIDVLTENGHENSTPTLRASLSTGHVLPSEFEFVSSIAGHACAFKFRGASSVSHVSSIIEQARGALDASVAAVMFVLFGLLSFSFFVLFSVCVPSSVIPFVPALGSVLFLQVLLPFVGFAMAMTDVDRDAMKRVPPKNDQAITFARKEGWKLYIILILKAVPPALLPQLFHLIVFGELLIHFEPDVVSLHCSQAKNWVDIVRCDSLKDYSGPAKITSGIVVLGQLALCAIVSSAGFVNRLKPLWEHPPWDRNHVWVVSLVLCLGLIVIYSITSVPYDVAAALPWYFYIISVILPILCLGWIEACKTAEIKLEKRAEKLRRLQFETRLGAWSPK